MVVETVTGPTAGIRSSVSMAKSSALLPDQAGEGPPRPSVLGILGSGMDIRSLMAKPAAQMQSAQLICGKKSKTETLPSYTGTFTL